MSGVSGNEWHEWKEEKRNMKKLAGTLRGTAAVVIAAGFLFGMKASAHHAFGAEFDPNRPIIVRGPVVKIEWTNPHAWFHVEHTNEDGTKAVWMMEAGTPNTLLRRGIHRNSVPVGTEVVNRRLPIQGSLQSRQRPADDVGQWRDVVHGFKRHRSSARWCGPQRACAARRDGDAEASQGS